VVGSLASNTAGIGQIAFGLEIVVRTYVVQYSILLLALGGCGVCCVNCWDSLRVRLVGIVVFIPFRSGNVQKRGITTFAFIPKVRVSEYQLQ
jgi:hypothetical protein